MWNKLQNIYEGDDNVRRAKEESLRGQFDYMKMREDENTAKYVERIKEIVCAIRSYGGNIEDKLRVRKVLKIFLLVYVIRLTDI